MESLISDETTYLSLLPRDIHHLIHNMMIRVFIHRAIIVLYSYALNNISVDYMTRQIKSVFSSHSIPVELIFIGHGDRFEINLTLPDHIAIPDQVIIDLLMLSRMEGYKRCNPTPQFNLLLKEYNLPYRIVEYDARCSNGGTYIDMSVMRVYSP